MGYSIKGKFFRKIGKGSNWEFLVDGELDFLKNLSNRGNSVLSGISEFMDDNLPKEAVVFYDTTTVCYVKNTPENIKFLEGNNFKKKMYGKSFSFIKDSIGTEIDSIKVDDKEILENLLQAQDKYIPIETTKKIVMDGGWYNIESFGRTLSKYENELKTAYDKYYKLKEIENSIDYFKLTDEQKESYFDELSYANECIEDLSYSIYACHKIIGLLDFMEYSSTKEDTDPQGYQSIDVAVFIYFL